MRPRRVMQTGWFGVNTPTLTPTISGSRSVAWLENMQLLENLLFFGIVVTCNLCWAYLIVQLNWHQFSFLVLYFQCQLTNIRDMGHGWTTCFSPCWKIYYSTSVWVRGSHEFLVSNIIDNTIRAMMIFDCRLPGCLFGGCWRLPCGCLQSPSCKCGESSDMI